MCWIKSSKHLHYVYEWLPSTLVILIMHRLPSNLFCPSTALLCFISVETDISESSVIFYTSQTLFRHLLCLELPIHIFHQAFISHGQVPNSNLSIFSPRRINQSLLCILYVCVQIALTNVC